MHSQGTTPGQDTTSGSRQPAFWCAGLFLLLELACRPFAAMGISDDESYVRTAQLLAQTGHFVYNGWATAMIGWQLVAAAFFIRIFGFSFTAARMTTLLVAVLTVFLLQRLLVRIGLTQRNAVLGTLMLSLTPVYMQLSATFMTDVQGLFAVIGCLYACVRALQSKTETRATAWIVGAVVLNAIVGSSRQIAWLGILVMVPCTLWMLRRNRQTVLVGAFATVGGAAFIFWALHWFQRQPYSLPEHIWVPITSMHLAAYGTHELLKAALETPFLLLPLLLAFLPELRGRSVRFYSLLAVFVLIYAAVGLRLVAHHSATAMLEPSLGDWLGSVAYYDGGGLVTTGPVVLGVPSRILLTILSGLGTLGMVLFGLRVLKSRPALPSASPEFSLSYKQLFWLLVPFAAAYFCALIPRATAKLLDRYLLELTLVLGIFLLRGYQDFVRPRLPHVTVFAIAVTALFAMGSTHDLFSFYRARVAITHEVNAAGIPAQQLDGGFEYNVYEQILRHGYLNDSRLVNPAGAYTFVPLHKGWSCTGESDSASGSLDFEPHYGLAFTPDACAGATAFAPVSYTRWLGRRTNLYVVHFRPGKD